MEGNSFSTDIFSTALPSHFQCMICYDIPHPDTGFFEAHCGNLICKSCCKQYLLTSKSTCPHCRELADFQFIRDNRTIHRIIQNSKINCCYCKTSETDFSEWDHHCIYECPNRFERVYNFLEYQSEEVQKLYFNPICLQLISTIKKPIQVISVNGEYQSGKSTLLNYMIADSKLQFATGDGINAKTKGAQIFIKNRQDDVKATIFIDTEGLGDKHSSFALHCLTFLISNHYMFRIRKNPSENEKRELQTILKLANFLKQKSGESQKNVFSFIILDTSSDSQVDKFKQTNKELIHQLASHAIIQVLGTPMINFDEQHTDLFTSQVVKYQEHVSNLLRIDIPAFYENGLDLVELTHCLLDAVNEFKSLDQLSQFGCAAFQIFIKDQAVKIYRKKLRELVDKTGDDADLVGLFPAFHEIATKESLLQFETQSIRDSEEYEKQKQELENILEDYRLDFCSQLASEKQQDYKSFFIGALTGTAVTAVIGAGLGFSILPSVLRFIRK